MTKVTLHMQIEEARREIIMRRQVYPNLVSRGKMRQAEANHAMERMEAILCTLEWVFKNQDILVGAVNRVNAREAQS